MAIVSPYLSIISLNVNRVNLPSNDKEQLNQFILLTVWITTNWKILREIGIPDHLTCLLQNLYAGQEATVRTGHGTTDWFPIGKRVRQGCILSPC